MFIKIQSQPDDDCDHNIGTSISIISEVKVWKHEVEETMFQLLI